MSHDFTARAKARLLFSVAALLVAALLFGRGERGRALWQDLRVWVEGQGGADDGTYWCPMDPQIVRPREGICPICSMDLVPFEGGGVASVPGVLQLSDRQVQQAGVRLGLAEVRGLVRDIDTTGRLEVDPSKRSVVTVDYPGASRIEELYVHATGERIRKGQVVATVKNPQAEALLTEYRRLLKEYAALRRVPEEAWRAAEALQEVDRVRKQFEDYGLPDPHINVLAAKPKHMFTDPVFPVIAFESGVALEEPTKISGQQIQQGGSLLSVADLGSLWLKLELYEHEMPFITQGSRVHFATSAAPGEAFQTQIQFIEPMMKERSQTFRARCRVSNRKGRLAPGMSVRARLASEVYEVLCVPESAVLQSGRRNVVIVSEGGGRFRPKLVELGRRHLSIAPATEDEDVFGSAEERFHELLSGVAAGDRVVVAGNFLLNAEAQFQGVLKKMYQAVEAQERAPVLTEEQLAGAQTLLDDYLALAGALTMDDSTDLARLGQALVTHASDKELRALSPVFESMAQAGQGIIAVARAAEPDLEQARRHFGSLSREVVTFLAEFAPARLAGGELFLFRCPMAEDYGFDLWVQADARLANPYMGQRMPECGMSAEFALTPMLARIIDWSLANRLLVCLGSVLLVVGGGWSMVHLPLDAIPDLSDVQVIVTTDWSGQDPQTVEDQITYPVSSALLNVSQVRDVRGFSFFGTSFVYVIFSDGTDPYWARSRVLERLSQVQAELPPGAVPALGPDGSGLGWVYLYTLEDTQGKLDLGQLRDLQDHYVRHQLGSVSGVAEVASLGGAVRQYQITVDPRSLLAYGLPLAKVIDAVRRSNRDVGGRVIEMAETEFMVRGRGRITSIGDLEAVIVGMTPDEDPIQLREVASVEIGPDIKRGIAEKNGQGEVVAGIVTMRYGENALRVIRAVKEKIAEIQTGLPEGVVIRKAYDRSGLIERSVHTLSKQLLEELLVVALVCMLFLWHARSALVSVVVLPLSILASFTVMYALGVSANIMSLGGIAIAIGTMVDAAVVMVENLHKHKEGADAPGGAGALGHWEIVRRASHEVGPALFFSLLVITVSFLPVFALEDQAGRLFKPLAITKTLSMACAAVLTLVLMPILMGFFVRGRVRKESENPVSRFTIAAYLPALRFALRFRKLSIGLALVLLIITFVPLARIGSEFMPSIREGDILAMPTTLPGISSTEARRTLQTQDRLLKEFPEVEVVLGKIGRADTALDPAPLAMVETHISLLPEDRWPKRIIEERWLARVARDMFVTVRSGRAAGDWGEVDPQTVAEQVSQMAHVELTKHVREDLNRGRTLSMIREDLGVQVVRLLAADLGAYLEGEGRLTLQGADQLELWLATHWEPAGADEIPMRRTSFDELVDGEMHRHIQIPGMPNWWLMPIETRIGMLTTGMRGNLGLKLYGVDLGELEQVATDLEQLLKDVPGTSSVIAERALGGHYLDIDIDREECARFGISVGDVQDVIQTAIGGMTVTTAIEERSRVPINLRYPRELRDDPVRLGRTLVATPGGSQLPLQQLARISIQDGPPVIKSENGLLLTNVPIDLEPGVDIGSYVERAQKVIDTAIASGELEIPTGTYTSWSGQYQLMQQVRKRLDVIVPLTLALIFVLVYLNMRSVTETLIAMATLPFALIGGVWLLYWMDYDFSVAVAIGFIALAGLATETAILMHVYLDLAYQERSRAGPPTGKRLRDAIVEGAVLRVRPKMMTVVTTVLALLPILWATGAGSGPMKRMAVPMIGGLFTSTLHTLVLIPVYYAMLHEWRARRRVAASI